MGAKEEKAINTKVELSGEREYKQACAQINTALSGHSLRNAASFG